MRIKQTGLGRSLYRVKRRVTELPQYGVKGRTREFPRAGPKSGVVPSATMQAPPRSVAVILEGRGCNANCFYCSHKAVDGDPDEIHRPYYAEGKRLRNQVGYTFGTSGRLIESIDAASDRLVSIRTGGGEPLLYPEFWQVADIARRNPHLIMTTCTNGIGITDEILQTVFTMPNFSCLAVSIDAATRETFKTVKRVDQFDRVLDNLQKFVASRRTRTHPRLQLNFVVVKSNVHEILPLVDLAHSLGANSVNYNLLNIRGPALGSEEYQARLVAENPQVDELARDTALRLIDEAAAKADSLGIATVHRGKARAKAVPRAIDWGKVFCLHPFTNLSVGHYRMNFCCWSKPEYSQIYYSNDDAELMDLWNHPKIVEARTLMLTRNAEKVCQQSCPLIGAEQVTPPPSARDCVATTEDEDSE